MKWNNINLLVFFLITLTVRIESLRAKKLTTHNVYFNFDSKNIRPFEPSKLHLETWTGHSASDYKNLPSQSNYETSVYQND